MIHVYKLPEILLNVGVRVIFIQMSLMDPVISHVLISVKIIARIYQGNVINAQIILIEILLIVVNVTRGFMKSNQYLKL